jgi:hypothetical protein
MFGRGFHAVLALNAKGSTLFRTTENSKILIFHLACQDSPSTSYYFYKLRRSADEKTSLFTLYFWKEVF